MATEAKYGGKEYTWGQLVKQMGVDRARVAAPELDPKYQQMVKQEGQAKGLADYSHKYIDPNTNVSGGMSLGDLNRDFTQGYQEERKRGGLLPTAAADVADIATFYQAGGGGGLGRALIGGKAPDPNAGKPKTTKSTTTGQPPANPFETAETQLFNSLVGQYQGAMNIVNPYISGANAAQYATSAQNVGNAFAGGGVEAPNQNTAGIISRDAQAYAAANNAGTQGVQNAIAAQGPANAAMMQASPYQSILAALQSEAQYKTETGAGTPATATGTTTPNAVTDPYGAAVALASESAGTGTAPGATTVQSANAKVNPVNPGASTPTTDTSGSSGQAGGS